MQLRSSSSLCCRYVVGIELLSLEVIYSWLDAVLGAKDSGNILSDV